VAFLDGARAQAQSRKEHERAEREKLIIRAARELAERVEYSQPVLYSHFKGKDAIMAAVAVEGCDDLGALTETFWAGLHGLVTLMRGGRLPRELHDLRLALFLARFTG